MAHFLAFLHLAGVGQVAQVLNSIILFITTFPYRPNNQRASLNVLADFARASKLILTSLALFGNKKRDSKEPKASGSVMIKGRDFKKKERGIFLITPAVTVNCGHLDFYIIRKVSSR